MKVVDLRNIFTSCNDVLIEISDTLIYWKRAIPACFCWRMTV